MNKNEPVRITFEDENNAVKLTTELNWDCDARSIINAVYGMMIGLTYQEGSILDAMREFVENKTHIENAFENEKAVMRLEEEKETE